MAAGNAEALRALSIRYSDLLTTFSERMLGDQTDAEEVVAETFWRAWHAAKDFDSLGSVAAWLTTIARHRSIDYIRARRSMQRLPRYDPAPDSVESLLTDLLLSERAQLVRAALCGLKERESTALHTAYYSGLSHMEITAQLGIPLGTVKTRIRTALVKLRATLSREAVLDGLGE